MMWRNALIAVLLQVFIHTVTSGPVNNQLSEGLSCPLGNGNVGICKKLPDCQSRAAEGSEGPRSVSSQRCGFDGSVEIVCCPKTSGAEVNLRPAEIACKQYNELSARNDKGSGKFPYMVALGYEFNNAVPGKRPVIYGCGGTLISPQYVLTAAHCANNVHNIRPTEVRIGKTDPEEFKANGISIPVSDVIMHPAFNHGLDYDDVAILRLERKVEITSTVKPVCLQTQPESSVQLTPDSSLMIVRLGAASFDNDGTPQGTSKNTLRFMDKQECYNSYYNNYHRLPNGLDNKMFCVYDTDNSTHVQRCHGNSGGPLLLIDTASGGRVLGITSYGLACGGPTPGVYNSVYSHLDWIEQNVWRKSEETGDIIEKERVGPQPL